MRIFIIITVIAAAYLGYEHYDNQHRQNAFNTLIETIDAQPINQFELKQSLNTQVTARCQAIGTDETNLAKMEECLNLVQTYQDECELQIFRLAPVEFEDGKEARDYGKRYQKCVLSNQFTYLVDNNTL
ncbi:hypothetical protein [Pseudoalteromonas sp.]|uniref:hypothetical protein n=1 Tax=Pseudoalteromonas sp. TaxID=53249 RepID=UPI0035673FCC